MALFNKYFSSNQQQRRDYEFYIGLCFEVQGKIFNDHIFMDPPSFSAQSDKDFLPLEKYNEKTIKSYEKLVLNAMLLSICIKKTFGHTCSLDDLWKKEDEGLKNIIKRFAIIMSENPLFLKMFKEYYRSEPSEPIIVGVLYIQNRFFDYADFLEEYFSDNFEPREEDYDDDEAPHDLEDYKARMIRLVYKYYAQPFCKYPKELFFVHEDLNIDEFENIINDFEKTINDACNYFSDKLSTGRF